MNLNPAAWANSSEAATLWGRLRSAPRSVLMLDYDGTLAPFHEDRLAAFPYPGVADRLGALSRLDRVRLILVSGRSAHELASLLHLEAGVEVWGSHGRERISSGGVYELFALAPVEQNALQEVARAIADQGFMDALEEKPSSLAVHWRSYGPTVQEQLRSMTISAFAGLRQPGNLQLLPFDGGLELRSNDRTKGHAVRQIASEEAVDVPMAYLGDDLTDEDAFVALGHRGCSILVRKELRPSNASFWLQPPGELVNFLDQWIEATRGMFASSEVSS